VKSSHRQLWIRTLSAAVGVAAAGTLAVMSAGTANASPPGPLTTVKIGIFPGNTSSSIWTIADQKGFFRREGVKADFVKFATGPALAAAVVSGSVDVAYGASSVSFDLAKQSPKLVVLGDFAEYVNWEILVAKDKATSSVSAGFPANVRSLKGLKIGVTALGGVVNKFVIALLQSAGVSPSDVTLIATGASNTAIPAMKNGRVDALAAVVSPQDLARQNVKSVLVVDAGIKGNAGPAMTNVLGVIDTTSRSFMQHHAATLNNYCKAMIAAVDWAKAPANLGAASQIVAKQLGISSAEAREELKHDLVSYTDTLSESVWNAQPAWITGGGKVPTYHDTVDASCGR
jgi:NitT/TauT family transport system substrate-binding protein